MKYTRMLLSVVMIGCIHQGLIGCDVNSQPGSPYNKEKQQVTGTAKQDGIPMQPTDKFDPDFYLPIPERMEIRKTVQFGDNQLCYQNMSPPKPEISIDVQGGDSGSYHLESRLKVWCFDFIVGEGALYQKGSRMVLIQKADAVDSYHNWQTDFAIGPLATGRYQLEIQLRWDTPEGEQTRVITETTVDVPGHPQRR